MEKTHIKKLRNPNYIGSYELMTDNGSSIELTVKIVKVCKEMVQNGDKKEECTVMHLVNQKPMILNSTNIKNIVKSIGSPFIEDWVNESIILYVSKIKAFGEMVDALRVKPIKVIKQKLNTDLQSKQLKDCKTLSELQTVYLSLPKEIQTELVSLKDELKIKLSNENK